MAPSSRRTPAEAPDLVVRTLAHGELGPAFLAAWDALDAVAVHRPCPRALARAGGVDGAMRVVAVSAGPTLLGVWPLVCTPAGVALRAGGSVQAHDGPTLHPDADVDVVMAAMWAELQTWSDVHTLELLAFLPGSPVHAMAPVADASARAGQTTSVRLDGGASGSARAEAGLRFGWEQDEDDRWQAILWAVELEMPGGQPTLQDELFVSLASAPGALEVFTLSAEDGEDGAPGERVAVQLALVDGDRCVVLRTVVAPGLEDCGVGGLLALEVADWCSEQGLSVLDFGGPLPDDSPELGALRSQSLLAASLPTRGRARRADDRRRPSAWVA